MAKGIGGGGGGHLPLFTPDVTGTVGNDVLTIIPGTAGYGGIAFGLAGDDTLNGSFSNDILIGGTGNDRLFGGDGGDTLEGGAGNDFMDGGLGRDSVTYANELAGVRVDLAITTAQNTFGAGVDTLINIEDLYGSGFNDTLLGTNGVNFISAGAGNDVIDGRGGDDMLIGGAGNDTIFGGLGNDSIMGDDGSDTIYGGAGDDYIVAGVTGRDTLIGGDGNDFILTSFDGATAQGGAGDDRISVIGGNSVVDGGLGNDYVSIGGVEADVTIDLNVTTAQNYSSAGTLTLTNVENISVGWGNDVITGNDAANFIDGGYGSNILSGGGGDDTIWTYGHDNTLNGGAGNDSLWNRGGLNGTLNGGDGNDTLLGGHFLNGGSGNDNLAGDIMTGGAGADVFQGQNVFQGNLTVTDFSRAEGDHFDFSWLSNTAGALNFVGYAAFDSTVGHNEIHVVAGAGFQLVEMDFNGDHISDYSVHVNGNAALTFGDFIL
jgi:Ca2+-binding RTX toxin-like protein